MPLTTCLLHRGQGFAADPESPRQARPRSYGPVAQLGAHAVQLYAPSFGPVAHMAPIRFASPFIKTSYHHIFGPVTHLAVNRDRYMGP